MARTKDATLDKEKARAIVKALEAGNHLDTAARIAGISPTRLRDWLAWGREGRSPAFRQFYEDAKTAEAKAEAAYLSLVYEAARDRGVWQAAAWYLERRYPERWGRKENLSVSLSGELETRQRKEVETLLANYAEVIREAEAIIAASAAGIPGDNGSGE